MCVLVSQSRPNLCNPMNCSLPGSSVHEILQARILEWVIIPFSGDLPNPGIKPVSPELQADSLPFEPLGKPTCTINGKGGSLILVKHDLHKGMKKDRTGKYVIDYKRLFFLFFYFLNYLNKGYLFKVRIIMYSLI